MPFIFDVPQQTQIDALFLQGQADPTAPGPFRPMYDYINNVLITGSPAPIVDPEVKKSQLWFSGATQANSGRGPYAIVIREYTQNQQRLHLGRPAPGGIGPGGLQAASNEVAEGVFNDTKLGNLQETPPRLPWTLLRVDQIARNDATAVGEVLFNIPGSSAASPQNAAWAGTVLHPLLGDDQSWRLISAPSAVPGVPAETVANTFDDWRNLLFAQGSYYLALRGAFEDAGYDLVTVPQLGELYADMRTALEACFISERFWSTGCSPALDSAMRGRAAGNGFAALGGLSGAPLESVVFNGAPQERILAQMQSGWQGVVVAPAAGLSLISGGQPFFRSAYVFFQGIGNAGQTASTSVRSPSELLADATAGTSGAALEARQALEGLSNFVVTGSTSPAPLPTLTTLTAEYLADRRDMLVARNLFDRALSRYGLDSVSSNDLAPTTFNDQGSGVVLTISDPLSLRTPRAVVFGSSSNDALNGGGGDDRLYGRDGNDTLTGAIGDDWFEGGLGADIYNVGQGRDTLRDEDGQGSIRFNAVTLATFERVGTDLWQTADSRFRLTRTQVASETRLLIVDTTSGILGFAQDTIEVRQWSTGQLGITLTGVADPNPTTQTIAPEDLSVNGFRDLYDVGSPVSDLVRSGRQYDNIGPSDGNDVVYAGDGSDRADGGGGADSLFGELASDYLRGGVLAGGTPATDNDTLVGGPSVDNLFGGIGADTLYAGERTDAIDGPGSSDQGDWMVGGAQDDTLIGSVARDFINGSAGRDQVLAGSGDDIVLGDAQYDFLLAGVIIEPFCVGTPAGIAARHRWNGAAWVTVFASAAPCSQPIEVQLTPLTHFQWSVVLNGDDFTFNPVVARPGGQTLRVDSGGDADLIRGGAGNDYLQGQTGSDILFGDDGNDRLIGDDVVALPAGSLPGNDQLFGGAGDDRLLGNSGSDVLNGDDGNDVLLGDDASDTTGGADSLYGGAGSDTLDGGAGTDVVEGQAGNDTELSGGAGDDLVLGGDGDDVLRGDGTGLPAGADVMDGGPGNDTVRGDGGNDTLAGGAGTDVVEGNDGNDLLILGDSGDTLRGGAGDDVFQLTILASRTEGAAVARIEDSAGNNRIRFESFVYPSVVQLVPSGADLRVNLFSAAYGVLVVGGASGNVVQNYEFADGRVFTHAQMLAGGNRGIRAVDAISSGNDYQRGTPDADVFDLLAGDDVGLGFAGNDNLRGGVGRDVIDGGAGDDILQGDDGQDRLHGGVGADTLDGGAGEDRLFGGDGGDQLSGGNEADQLDGGVGNDTLAGGAADDLIDGGPGVDALQGSAGFDEYFVAVDDDLVTGTTIIDTAPNALRFDASISPNAVSISLDGADAIVRYGDSTLRVVGGATGNVISELRFDGRPPISFTEFFSRIFGDGFEP